jgi:uncharacterized protein (DUF302 family)
MKGSQEPVERGLRVDRRTLLMITGVALAGICSEGRSEMTTDSLTTGLITAKSNFGAKETADRLAAAVEAKGMAVFARIDHAAAAKRAGLELAPTELLIFGSAKAGTPLMQTNPVVGIDLPLKGLVWRDSDGKVWLTYNDPHWILKRHGLGAAFNAQADQMAAGLAALAKQATGG